MTTNGDVMFVVTDGPTDTVLSTTVAQDVSVALPKPAGGVLGLGQSRQVSANAVQSPISFLVSSLL